jgi:putative ABC transport system permease protein
MTRVVLRGMLGRKLRTGLTAFAVVLGVAMVSGAYILTDTLLNAANGLEQAAYEGVDAVVSHREAFDVDTNNGFSEPKPVPAALIARVRSVPQVGVAQGEIQDEAQLIGRDGKTIGGSGGPTFAVGYDGFQPRAAGLSPFKFDAGGFPRGPRDIAIDAGTADDKGYGWATRSASARAGRCASTASPGSPGSATSSRSATPPRRSSRWAPRSACSRSRARSTRSWSTASRGRIPTS